MLYFAYGSNMCTGRLRQRVPSAAPVRIAKLLNRSLRFHKRSDDRSGKCRRNDPPALLGHEWVTRPVLDQRVQSRPDQVGQGLEDPVRVHGHRPNPEVDGKLHPGRVYEPQEPRHARR